MWKASGVIGEGLDSFPIVEEIEAKKRGIRCVVYSKLLKLTVCTSCFWSLTSPYDQPTFLVWSCAVVAFVCNAAIK